MTLESRNDLFFIPMKAWGIVGVGGGLVMALLGALGLA